MEVPWCKVLRVSCATGSEAAAPPGSRVEQAGGPLYYFYLTRITVDWLVALTFP